MNLNTAILGKGTVEKLQERGRSAVLEVGSDHLTRGELAAVGCFNFIAARILTRVLHHELRVKNLRQVFDEIPPTALALPGLDVISLATLGAAFEAKGIGGATPLENYVKKHAGAPTSFSSMKHHAQAENARERTERKRRKASRRDKAHHLRVTRFEARQAS